MSEEIRINAEQFNRIKTFKSVTVITKNKRKGTLAGERIELFTKDCLRSAREVLNIEGVTPTCPSCEGGCYMTNEDKERNNYCGNCGTKLDWSAVDEGKYNDE